MQNDQLIKTLEAPGRGAKMFAESVKALQEASNKLQFVPTQFPAADALINASLTS